MKEVILALKKLIVVMKIALADVFVEATKVSNALEEINVKLIEKRDLVSLLKDEIEFCVNSSAPEWEEKYTAELKQTIDVIDVLEMEKWELSFKLEALKKEKQRLVDAITSNKKFLKETRKKGKKKR